MPVIAGRLIVAFAAVGLLAGEASRRRRRMDPMPLPRPRPALKVETRPAKVAARKASGAQTASRAAIARAFVRGRLRDTSIHGFTPLRGSRRCRQPIARPRTGRRLQPTRPAPQLGRWRRARRPRRSTSPRSNRPSISCAKAGRDEATNDRKHHFRSARAQARRMGDPAQRRQPNSISRATPPSSPPTRAGPASRTCAGAPRRRCGSNRRRSADGDRLLPRRTAAHRQGPLRAGARAARPGRQRRRRRRWCAKPGATTAFPTMSKRRRAQPLPA